MGGTDTRLAMDAGALADLLSGHPRLRAYMRAGLYWRSGGPVALSSVG
jgi:hypothetical protein